MTLSPMKDKGEDFESHEIIKQRTLSPMKQASTKGLNLMRKQEIDSLRGPLILNLKDRTLDMGNWYIKRNLCTYS